MRACVPGSGAGVGRCSEPVCPMANDLYEQAGRQHRDRADGLKGAREGGHFDVASCGALLKLGSLS
jgi:hypothetical protein